jgi:hypothetical protein
MANDYFPDSVGFQTAAYTAVASIAALLFDFIITFDSEVRWTWGRGWGMTRIIFIISRYVPFVGLVMTVYYSVGSTHGGIPDHGTFTAVYDGVRWLGIAAAEFLLVLRTYAVWGGDKRFLTVTLIFTTVISVLVLAISQVGASESGGLYLRPEFLLLTLFIQIRLAYLRKDMTLAFFMVYWCWLSLCC